MFDEAAAVDDIEIILWEDAAYHELRGASGEAQGAADGLTAVVHHRGPEEAAGRRNWTNCMSGWICTRNRRHGNLADAVRLRPETRRLSPYVVGAYRRAQ
ncbi:MAG: hypothetical protein ACRELG_10315 [Gemmataceae bacterium]